MPLKGSGMRTPTPGGVRNSGPDSGLRLMAVLLAVSIGIFALGSHEDGTGVLNAIRGGFNTAMTPIRYVGVGVTAPFRALGNVFSNLTASQETLTQLQQEKADLEAKNAQLEEAERTAQRLQDLLALQDTYSLQSTAARIISASTDSWTRTVTLDKGSASGIAVGMPVTDSTGAIGQVIECGATSSTVRLLADENSSVSAMVQSSRAQGILKGSADGTLSLTLVATDQTVSVGDMVVTSGLGGVFPKGLPLGKVTSVNREDGALYYDISVEPLSKTEGFEEVLVITSLTEGQQASADDIAEADSQDTSLITGSSSSDSSDDSSDSSGSSSSDSSDSSSSSGSDSSSSDSSSSSSSQ